MPPKPQFSLSADALAKQQARRLKKLEQAANSAATSASSSQTSLLLDNPRGKILDRPWIILREPTADAARVSIKTWNLLAQTLVRRKLFPMSDCLRASERQHMLFRELLHPRADILCLQEVDRLEKILPFLDNAGYHHVYASGPGKKHGCLIAFDRNKYEKAGEKVVVYDTNDRGASFRTKNIGSIVALQDKTMASRGLVVATTHLFWHPSYNYERTRQAGLLLRAATSFRNDLSVPNWPCVLAGDFNFDPADPAYAFLVGEQIADSHKDALARSRIVHATIDPSVPITTRKQIGSTEEAEGETATDQAGEGGDEDEGENAADPDRRITNARPARPEDMLFTNDEFVDLYHNAGAPLKSAVEEGKRQHGLEGPSFGTRAGLPKERIGYYEPEWTSYTYYWKTVLDYIFVLDPSGFTSEVCGFLQAPRTEDLEPGIPMMGVSSSDHVSMHAELSWSAITQTKAPNNNDG